MLDSGKTGWSGRLQQASRRLKNSQTCLESLVLPSKIALCIVVSLFCMRGLSIFMRENEIFAVIFTRPYLGNRSMEKLGSSLIL